MNPLSNLSAIAIRGSGWRLGVALIALFSIALATPGQDGGAHAFLERSEPAANALLATAPEDVRIWFTEPLEPAYAGAELFDADGTRISTGAAFVDPDDPNLLVLPLPVDLGQGTYTVAWRNISAVDGHPAEGYFAFTIGDAADVVVPSAPAATQFSGPSTGVQATGRWLVLLGLMVILGMLVTSFRVLPGGMAEVAPDEGARLWRWLRRIMLAGLAVAGVGSCILLVDQTLTVESSFSLTAAVDLLRDSNVGRYWLLRSAAIAVLAIVLYLTPRFEDASRGRRIMLVVLAVLPLVPVALTSHAAAIGPGEGAAALADLAHLVAGSIWVGGLLALVPALVVLRSLSGDQRRSALASMIPRFSTLAIASVLVLVASGLYATWLQVGNLTALTETDHGRTLILKLLLVVVMLCLGAINLLVLEPRLRSAAATPVEFRRTVMAEALLGIAVLLLVGIMTSLPTARGEIEASSGQIVHDFSSDGTHAQLVIAPGAAGANRYTLDFEPGVDLSPESQVFLRFSAPGGGIAGLSEEELLAVGENRFEASGSELSVVGEWDVEAILRRPERADWRVTAALDIGTEPPATSAPGEAARFPGIAGGLAMLAVLFGLPLIIGGLREPRYRLLLGVGICLLAAGIAGLAVTAAWPG